MEAEELSRMPSFGSFPPTKIHRVRQEQVGADFIVYVTVRQNIAAKFEVVKGIKRYTETGGKRDEMVNVSTQFLKIYLQEL